MHEMWGGFIQEFILISTQALILTGTFLLHKAVKSVSMMLQERIMEQSRSEQ